MRGILILAAVVLGPILIIAAVRLLGRGLSFRWAYVFRLYLTILFGGIGLYGHLMHPESVMQLIPPFFPERLASTYASGVLELAFAVLLWTRWARVTGWLIIVYLVLVIPFNIYGWTLAGNSPNFVTSPFYLWLRVPMQALFIAFAYFGTREPRRSSAIGVGANRSDRTESEPP